MTEKEFKVINISTNGMTALFKLGNDNLSVYDVGRLVNELVDENEQLKQQIQQLQHWNKCLAEKRHQELSYRPYTSSKSEKEIKELLEPKLFNCSDR